MGPQELTCGNVALSPRRSWRARGFNGAAGINLRKSESLIVMLNTWLSFNGAAGINLRKFDPLPCLMLHPHGFNGAAGINLRKYVVFHAGIRAFSASMGPQELTCGNQHCGGISCGASSASMGPQELTCGNGHGFAATGGPEVASMGPQELTCGNNQLLPYPDATGKLQWGRRN